MSTEKYIGDELGLFQHATNWKRYWSDTVADFVGGEVLEVGGGLGSNASYILDAGKKLATLTLLEPDAELARDAAVATGHLHPRVEIITGTLGDIPENRRFDTILYIDVLEHISDDAGELRAAAGRLRPGGHLIVLVPAFAFLYTEFDRHIGHFRRYDKGTLSAVAPPILRQELLTYRDSAGFLASVANRAFLKQASPTLAQVRFWDRVLVPFSRWTDPVANRAFGKSLIGVWKRPV